jgi:long-subunit acyl-CoA synthetase (AMP-forming)
MLARIREMVGGRVTILVTGSAPTSDAVKSFLEVCFNCPVIDGYGSTEAGTSLLMWGFLITAARSPFVSPSIGGISCNGRINLNVDVKLVDVPDLNYFSTDKPYPRGEVLVKTDTMLTEYYKNPDATSAALTPDGYGCVVFAL